MPVFARLIFGLVNFAARKGLAEAESSASTAEVKQRARQTGIRGETYAYWYLRRHGYILIARNYTAPGLKGEIDLIGYDGPVLAFVEVKTRARRAPSTALRAGTAGDTPGRPEDAVTPDKRRYLTRMARHFLAERHLAEAQCRFDVLAIESQPGVRPAVRLHKGAF